MKEEKVITEDEIIRKTTENVFEVLRKNGFEIKERKNTFQRAEQLLYLMPQLKDAINQNKKKIKDLQEHGIKHNKGAVHIIPQNMPLKQDEEELINNKINQINQRNHIINSELKWVNRIVNTMSTDKFYEIIDLKYYKNKTYEEIAEYFKCDVSTISRNKTRIINHLRTLFFPDDSIGELGA